MPSETEFSCGFELAQKDVEMREKNAGHMSKNALKPAWNTRHIEETQKLIDQMPKIMEATIETNGGMVLNPLWSLDTSTETFDTFP